MKCRTSGGLAVPIRIWRTPRVRPLLAVALVLSLTGVGLAISGSGQSTQAAASKRTSLVWFKHHRGSGGSGGGSTTTTKPTTKPPTTTTTSHPTTTTTTAPVTTTTTLPPTTTTTTVPPTTTTTSHPTTTTTTVPVTTTTTTTTQPSGGNCTNPSFSTSDAGGTDNTDPNNGEYWWVNNDAWSGSHGPQTIDVCNQSSWYAVSNQPNIGGQVETYPDTEYDVGGRNSQSTKPISGWHSITSTFSEADPTGVGGWDAAYDLWLNNWSTEIMIWNEWSGAQSYWPGQATTSVTLGGVPYTFVNNGGELMFFRTTQVKSGSVDILAALNWLVSQGLVKSSDVPTQLEYGVEVCYTSGSETFPMTGLTFNLS
jgi:hypothetical protein